MTPQELAKTIRQTVAELNELLSIIKQDDIEVSIKCIANNGCFWLSNDSTLEVCEIRQVKVL